MLDTVKLGIPLTQKQYEKVHTVAYDSDKAQWILLIPTTGELQFRRVSGLAEADQNSFHREIRWDIPAVYRPPIDQADGSLKHETFLAVELSLPKLYYGHNIHLLYEFSEAIAKLKQLLEKRFNFQSKSKLVDIYEWQVWRVDCCYAWRMPSQQIAQQVLDSLKHLHYPRKKPTIRPTSIDFVGNTYSVKFYLKLPEFRTHDLKALIKAKAKLEWINHLEQKADGVLRYEATLRRKYLERQDIRTVADLVQPNVQVHFDFPIGNDLVADMALHTIMAYNHEVFASAPDCDLFQSVKDGDYFSMPAGVEVNLDWSILKRYKHPGGGMTISKKDNPTAILQYFLEKFIGEHGMQRVDEVEAKLRAVYQDRKAGRLLGTWLCVQKLGVAKAKELFGKDAYYRDCRDMKKAGIGLIEANDKVVTLNPDFLRNFRLQVPSEHVTNRFDDYPDHDNVLNFVPKPTA